MSSSIDKLTIRNEVFAKILKENGLVLATDRIFEKAVPFSVWISRTLNNVSSRIIMDDSSFDRCCRAEEDMHFIHNGKYDSSFDKMIFYSSICGAFSIGICTDDPEEYELGKESYLALKRRLEEQTHYGRQVNTIETEKDGHKAFILTHRRNLI